MRNPGWGDPAPTKQNSSCQFLTRGPRVCYLRYSSRCSGSLSLSPSTRTNGRAAPERCPMTQGLVSVPRQTELYCSRLAVPLLAASFLGSPVAAYFDMPSRKRVEEHMTKQEIVITSTQFPYNMADWCTEKTANVLQEMAMIVEVVNEESAVSTEVRDSILSSLYPAIWDATKMLAFACGATWEPSDREIILKGGRFAFEELQTKYGMLSQEKDRKRVFDIEEFIAIFRSLLDGPRHLARPQLCDLFGRTRIKEPILESLDDELERVNMGTEEWSEFVQKASCLLDGLEARRDNSEET